MDYIKAIGAEPIPGYRLVEPLGMGGFGEVWKCEVPGGLCKAIKFVRGNLNGLDPENTAKQELQALERVKAIRHPFVLSLERVEIMDGELGMVMELADRNLDDRLRECQEQGMIGVPRDELLSFLHDAAEAIDLLNFKHDLQHLDIKPSNLFLFGDRVKLADFGLVQSLEELRSVEDSQMRFGVTPLYSSPEALQGICSRHSDQYSLAVVFQQVLTGVLPFTGKNMRQLLVKHLMEEPNLAPLPQHDRPIVARALKKKPEDRFASCQEFIQALMLADDPSGGLTTSRFFRLAPKQNGDDSHLEVTAQLPAQDHGEDANKTTSSLKNTLPFGVRNPVKQTSILTTKETMPFRPPKIPGYQEVDCLQAGLLGEVWKLVATDGKQILARALPAFFGMNEALQKYDEFLRNLAHPCLPPLELLEHQDRSLLLVEYDRPTLLDRFRGCVLQKRVGIERLELLHHLGRAAKVLDELYECYEIPHGHLHPSALILAKDSIQITDVGLVAIFWHHLQLSLKGVNERYAAPEMLDECSGPAGDQYSLALMYTEMLTGFHPRPQPLSGATRHAKIDLTFLPSEDLPAVAKALHADPEKRFSCCQEFMESLGVHYHSQDAIHTAQNWPMILPVAQLHDKTARVKTAMPHPQEYFQEFFYRATRVRRFHSSRYCQYAQGHDHELYGQVSLRLPELMLRDKLQAFADEWHTKMEHVDRHHFVFRRTRKRNLWQKLTSSPSGLQVHLHVQPSARAITICAGAHMHIQAFGVKDQFVLDQLKTQGPELLESLCAHLQAARDQRQQARVPLPIEFTVYPVRSGRRLGKALPATAKDVSLTSISFYLTDKPTANQVYLHLPHADGEEAYVLLAALARVQQLEEHLFEIGAVLVDDTVLGDVAEQLVMSDTYVTVS